MNATSLYVSTCRVVLQANPEEPGCLQDLYRLLPYLRQSLSCTVCGCLLMEPHTPTETNCQHHVCRSCKGGKKKLKPSCSWCKNYDKYVENMQLRILLQCYKKLCEYLTDSYTYRLMCKSNSTLTLSEANITNMIEFIKEGVSFKDEFKCNAGLTKSAYSILPCIYTSASTQTVTPDLSTPIEEELTNNLSNGSSSLYSVMYAGSGHNIVIKRTDKEDGRLNDSRINLIKGGNFKRPLHKRGPFKGRGRAAKDGDQSNHCKKVRMGCRCGNATASPGKLTCCGQRCPCYVESKACLDCKCRGCRNPHTKEGQKIIRDLAEQGNSSQNSLDTDTDAIKNELQNCIQQDSQFNLHLEDPNLELM